MYPEIVTGPVSFNVGLTSYVYEDVYVRDMSQLLWTCPDQINMYHTVRTSIVN